jgi:hypothetical protein
LVKLFFNLSTSISLNQAVYMRSLTTTQSKLVTAAWRMWKPPFLTITRELDRPNTPQPNKSTVTVARKLRRMPALEKMSDPSYRLSIRSKKLRQRWNEAVYWGNSWGEFKDRYRNHKKSFELQRYANKTELSKHIWKLKRSGRPYNTIWSILKKAAQYASGRSRCNLCLQEKLLILKFRDKNLLNKRSEIFSKCVHHNNFYREVWSARVKANINNLRARTVTSSSKEKPTVFKNNVSCWARDKKHFK